jgi:hypothetical protein
MTGRGEKFGTNFLVVIFFLLLYYVTGMLQWICSGNKVPHRGDKNKLAVVSEGNDHGGLGIVCYVRRRLSSNRPWVRSSKL